MNTTAVYNQLRNSGIDWIGPIPSTWTVAPLKSLGVGRDALFIDGDWIESKDLSDAGIRYITTGNVGEGRYKEQGSGFISEDTFERLRCTEVRPGDVLVSRLNLPIARACIVPDLGARIVTSVDNVIVRPRPGYDARYIVFMLSSASHFFNTENLARGTTMRRISRSGLGNIRYAFPSHQEQTAIADALDRETARIDALIEKKTRFIELLKEKRQALITQAVTKGLDPTVPMKDSGVDWIGEVPAHWEVKPLCRVVSVNDDVLASGFPVNAEISYVDISSVTYEKGIESSESMVFANAPSRAQRLTKKGDVVISTVRTYLKAFAEVDDDHADCVFSTGFAVLRRMPDQLEEGFLKWMISNELVVQAIESHSTGVSYPAINAGDLVKLEVAVPPSNEQVRIAATLDHDAARIDNLIDKSLRSVDLLKEHRSALITAAVTGQIDLREDVA